MMEVVRNGSRPEVIAPEMFFTGTARIQIAFKHEPPSRLVGGLAIFEPGSRTHWHSHPLGQTLYITSGVGWTQCEGEPIVEVRAGDMIVCPPGHKHWHGATATTSMAHFTVQEALDSGKYADWFGEVTDEQYLAGPVVTD
jgi:quercetin dioxygenase-like cupin family protein